MNKINFTLLPKQTQCWMKYYSESDKNILYGGAGGGGKTKLISTILLNNCIKYPGSRWLLGRAVLKALTQTTLISFFEVVSELKLRDKFIYREQRGEIQFKNGSLIILKDLALYPSDPNFEALHGYELTGAFIDEGSQVTEKVYHILMTRIRYKLKEFNIKPKILIATNPCKNWIYEKIYRPYKENRKSEFIFIPALPKDNPHLDQSYIKSLLRRPEYDRRRLLYGDWEYDDNTALIQYNKIIDIFSNSFVDKTNKKYMSCDIATTGSDEFVIFIWNGLVVEKIYSFKKITSKEIENKIRDLAQIHSVPLSHITYDSDGVGDFLYSYLGGGEEVKNGSSPIVGTNYKNLKTELLFKLSELINDNKIFVENIEESQKEKLLQDLQQIKRREESKEGKIQLEPKDMIKQNIGRSPDYSDAMYLRMIFEIQPANDFKAIDISGIF